MLRAAVIVLGFALLSACTGASDLDDAPVPLGDFSLGHNVVVAPKAQTAAIGRDVSKDELTDALQEAIAQRFERYDGPKDYHFGVSIEGYLIARAGIPVVAAPKSAMIIRLTVWDDAKGAKLNNPPEQLTIFETLDGNSLIGSGWTQSAETQVRLLSANAAQAIEDFLVEKNRTEGWFDPDFVPPATIAETAAQAALPATGLLAPSQ
jgi:hypothetical protein